ncbi:MAG: tetratricopeptide repeat protein [Balneolales bacterium]|nr:tetratricopeptide repeat protein [Balneolales bacterium]
MLVPGAEMVQAQPQARIDSLTNEVNTNPAIDSTRIENLISLTALLGRSNPLLARRYAAEAISISKELGFTEPEARAQGNMGISYAIQAETDSALIYLEEALRLFISIDDLRSIARMNSSIGTIYAIQNKYEEAITYLLDSIPIFEQLGDSLNIGLTYFNIGQMYSDQGLYEESLERTLRASEMYRAIGNERKVPVTNAAIAQSLIELDREEEALIYIEQGLEVVKNYIDVPSERNLHNMAGRIYESTGNLEDARNSYSKALEKANQLNSNRLAIEIKFSLAGVDYRLENYASSKKYLTDIVSIIEERRLQGTERLKSNAMDLLSRVEANMGNTESALEYLKMAKVLSDSIYREENARAIAELETIYETEKKENQILLLEAENEATNLKFLIAIILGSSLIIIIGISFWQYQRRKSKERTIEVQSIKRELEQYGVLLAEKNAFLSSLKENLVGLKGNVKSFEAKKELNVLVDSLHHNVNLSETEEEMFQKIEQVNTGFFMKLRKNSTDITKNDERLASLVQMDLSNKDIANILNINPRSVNQAKYRLKKKLNLSPEIDLKHYLRSVGA